MTGDPWRVLKKEGRNVEVRQKDSQLQEEGVRSSLEMAKGRSILVQCGKNQCC